MTSLALWKEMKRKAVHVLGLVYVLGLIYIPRRSYLLILGSLVVVLLSMEFFRLRNPVFHRAIFRFFGPLLREHEENRITGLFWMLLGVFGTVLLLPSIPLATTAILYLILGDGVASLIGMRFGGPFWPGRTKRFSGSLACFLVCVFVGFVLLRPSYGWHGIFLGAFAATIVEWGIIPVDDNMSIPIASSVVLMLCYGITPFF